MRNHPLSSFQRWATFIFFTIGVLFISQVGYFLLHWERGQINNALDDKKAYNDIVYQVSLGPRTPGSQAHATVKNWISSELGKAGWSVTIQKGNYNSKEFFNIIAYRNNNSPEIIIGAHYDSRIEADQDPSPDKRKQPVPGANDGASGVAVLLQLAYTLPHDKDNIGLVFFDTEDQGNIPGWEWIIGSQFYVSQLGYRPAKVIIIDMVGDRNLSLYFETNSDRILLNSLWDQAKSLGFESIFIPENKNNILDDHIPFIKKGIPAVDIIDFDYPYWHTTEDTPDKISQQSLKIVTQTVLTWLINN